MRFYLAVGIFLSLLIQWPVAALATGAGFVPDDQIWFSNESLTIGKPTQIYTAIINNNYYSLNANVGFFVNQEIIDTATINNLRSDKSRRALIVVEHKFY